MTLPTVLVLHALLGGETYGLRICETTGLQSGTVSPILRRLTEAGWLTERWEDINPAERGRPPRHYYGLTAEGQQVAREAVERAPKALNLTRSDGPGRS